MTELQSFDRWIHELARQLGVGVRDIKLWRRAMTHRSYANEKGMRGDDNERLEFLGDAVIEIIVRTHLYETFPSKTEGDMTAMRHAIVRAETLADVASKLGLEDGLRFGGAQRDEGGAWRTSLLSDALEALMATVYLEHGFDVVRRVVLDILAEALVRIRRHGIPIDPKSQLQEWLQARYKQTATYAMVEDRGPDAHPRFVCQALFQKQVIGEGKGPSIQNAEQAAARQALSKLKQKESPGTGRGRS